MKASCTTIFPLIVFAIFFCQMGYTPKEIRLPVPPVMYRSMHIVQITLNKTNIYPNKICYNSTVFRNNRLALNETL